MDRSLGTTAQPRIQDVTPQIQKIHQIYGASDNTNPAYSSSNRSLNYANGGSIQSPEHERVTIVPFTLNYKDSVGLFGKENHFVKVNVQINTSIALACFEDPGWECAAINEDENKQLNGYYTGEINLELDTEIVNNYKPAEINKNSLREMPNSYISIDLNNLKTGNKYIDAWFDVRLYTANREEHPYDKMYVRLNDYFYIGFHARNTRRLGYNVECVVGGEYVPYEQIENKRYIMRR